jgi:hypothetical protein
MLRHLVLQRILFKSKLFKLSIKIFFFLLSSANPNSYGTGMDTKSEAKLPCFEELDVLLLELGSPSWKPKDKYIAISERKK